MRLLWTTILLAGCTVGTAGESFEDLDEDEASDPDEIAAWVHADELSGAHPYDPLIAAGELKRNNDITTVVVWSQNIKMGVLKWRNIVRCMGDRACNSLGAIPDVVLLQEASCDNVKEIKDQMSKARDKGGLGVGNWGHYCVENPNSGGITGHWMSNGMIYRSDRFALESNADARKLEIFTGDSNSCSKRGRVIPMIKLLDKPRAAAGLLERRVTLVTRHDDPFGGGEKNTCPAANSPTTFCNWQNSKLIDEAVRDIGGGVRIMSGDWNYAAKYCKYDGVESKGFKYAYGCTTNGVRTACGTKGNLGWRDPILSNNPAAYDDRKVIDFMHIKDAHDVTLNKTPRNSTDGVIGKHFFCEGHGPYSDGGVADHPNLMSDHHALLMRVHY
jgi:hypothetical protein